MICKHLPSANTQRLGVDGQVRTCFWLKRSTLDLVGSDVTVRLLGLNPVAFGPSTGPSFGIGLRPTDVPGRDVPILPKNPRAVEREAYKARVEARSAFAASPRPPTRAEEDLRMASWMAHMLAL